jgi:hypothetical protein
MLSSAEYTNAWLAYILAMIVGLWCFWYLLSKLPLGRLRMVLVCTLAGFLAMPVETAPSSAFLAPAWLMAISETLFDGHDAFARAGSPLVAAVLLGAGLGIIIEALWAFFQPKAAPTAAPKTQRQPSESAKTRVLRARLARARGSH